MSSCGGFGFVLMYSWEILISFGTYYGLIFDRIISYWVIVMFRI